MTESTVKITSFDVFPNGTAKPAALLRYMQQVAREDCDKNGCTYAFMRSLNTVFVLTRLGLDLLRPIRSGETLTIRTYNNRITGIIFDREYDLFVGDEEVGHASTFWVLIRYDTRALVRPAEFPVDFYSHEIDCKTVEIPRRFGNEDAAPAGERIVRVSDLDENNHLNNCVYADIALDALPDFNGLDETVLGFRIAFSNEARLGDALSLSAKRQDGALAGVAAFNQNTQKPCFDSLWRVEKV
ncbi:MAG: hypothetical protein IJR88_00345 [Clostridia bacterium]|nr:hypothetical protein [Clostridia bacterium]